MDEGQEEEDEPDRDDLSVISNVSENKEVLGNDFSIFEVDDDDEMDERKTAPSPSLARKEDVPFRSPLEAHKSFMAAAKAKDTLANLK